MNKQEVIEKIKNISVVVSDTTIDYKEVMVSMNEVLNIINQLDEPEKPVLNKDEAEWIDKLTDVYDVPDALYYITRCGYGYDFTFEICGKTYELPLEDGITYGELYKLKERLVNAVLYGYEVKEEKLYTVELPNPHDTCHVILFKNKNGNVTIEYDYDDNWETEKGYQLTEEEIKEDFAWAWQFAEEVKE